jgi:hypothetical protein
VPDLSNPLYGLFAGGGVLALIGTLLTNRSGRQREFDNRVDQALVRAEADNVRLELRIAEVEAQYRAKDRECRDNEAAAEAENRFLALENTRLRRVLIEHGIEPDPSLKGGPPRGG